MTHKELTGRSSPEVRVEEINRSKLRDWFECKMPSLMPRILSQQDWT